MTFLIGKGQVRLMANSTGGQTANHSGLYFPQWVSVGKVDPPMWFLIARREPVTEAETRSLSFTQMDNDASDNGRRILAAMYGWQSGQGLQWTAHIRVRRMDGGKPADERIHIPYTRGPGAEDIVKTEIIRQCQRLGYLDSNGKVIEPLAQEFINLSAMVDNLISSNRQALDRLSNAVKSFGISTAQAAQALRRFGFQVNQAGLVTIDSGNPAANFGSRQTTPEAEAQRALGALEELTQQTEAAMGQAWGADPQATATKAPGGRLIVLDENAV